MSFTSDDDDQARSPTTFKEAYAVLQRHAETLRRQQEPNIDELVNIVTESVNAYRICKERIDAVEQALERTLGEAEVTTAAIDNTSESEVQHTPDNAQQTSTTSRDRSQNTEEFDDDIPF